MTGSSNPTCGSRLCLQQRLLQLLQQMPSGGPLLLVVAAAAAAFQQVQLVLLVGPLGYSQT